MTARVAYGQAKDANDGLTAAERASQEADKKGAIASGGPRDDWRTSPRGRPTRRGKGRRRLHDPMRVYAVSRRRRSAQVEVPKNEFFIAKLNKATEDADLELIFSRFGRIESCDIVRDWKTGDSQISRSSRSRRRSRARRPVAAIFMNRLRESRWWVPSRGTTMLTQSFRAGPAWKRIRR